MSINTNLTNTVYTFSSKIWFVHFWFCLDFKLSPDGLFVSILWFFHSYHQTILPSSISQFTGILLSWLEHSVHSLPNVYVTGHCFHYIVHALTSNKAFWWQFWSFTLRLSCILWRQVSFSLDVGYWVNLPELATVDKRDWEFLLLQSLSETNFWWKFFKSSDKSGDGRFHSRNIVISFKKLIDFVL